MNWTSFFIGFCTMGGMWLTLMAGIYIAYNNKGDKKDE